MEEKECANIYMYTGRGPVVVYVWGQLAGLSSTVAAKVADPAQNLVCSVTCTLKRIYRKASILLDQTANL